MFQHVIQFKGEICFNGDVNTIDIKELQDYLAKAVSLEIDTEDQGVFSDDVEITAIGLDWSSLEVSPDKT